MDVAGTLYFHQPSHHSHHHTNALRNKNNDERPLPRPHNAGNDTDEVQGTGQGREGNRTGQGREQGSRRDTSRAQVRFFFIFLLFSTNGLLTCRLRVRNEVGTRTTVTTTSTHTSLPRHDDDDERRAQDASRRSQRRQQGPKRRQNVVWALV
jgi:hypothetical protein